MEKRKKKKTWKTWIRDSGSGFPQKTKKKKIQNSPILVFHQKIKKKKFKKKKNLKKKNLKKKKKTWKMWIPKSGSGFPQKK